MKALFTITLLAFAAFAGERALAQGFQDEPTCYSWEGGHKSSGSFSKCGPAWVMPTKAPAVAVPAAVVPAPVLSSPVCPPHIYLQPEPKKVKPKAKPRPAPLKC